MGRPTSSHAGHANSFPPADIPSERVCAAADDIIQDINHNLHLSIPLRVLDKKLPKDRSVEERCHQKLTALCRRKDHTALNKCIRDVYQYAEWNQTLNTSHIASFLLDCLIKAITTPQARAALDNRAVQSFDPSSLRRQSEHVRLTPTSTPESDGDTEVAESDGEDANFQRRVHTCQPPGRMEHHHSHTLPQQGFPAPSMEHCPTLLAAPFPVRYECIRYAITCNIPITDIEASHAQAISHNHIPGPQSQRSSWTDQTLMREAIKDLTREPLPSPVGPDAWAEALKAGPNVSTSARLRFSKCSSDTSTFKLELSPLKLEPTSRRFFRKFGLTRFLVLKFPDLNDPPIHLRPKQNNPLGVRVHEWLEASPKYFAGNSWGYFFFRPVNDRNQRSSETKNDTCEAFFFAIQGPGLERISLRRLIMWHIPLEGNRMAPLAKSFDRIKLGLSNTHPTIEFTPSQVHYVPDILADGTPEDTRFNDPSLNFPARTTDQIQGTVMNDGCSRISYAAALKAWDLVRGNKRCSLPSAFQARIGPAKGMWIVETQTHPDNSKYGELWIEISASQKKFEPHSSDTDPSSNLSDKHRLTFEIVSWSDRPSTGRLYKDYFPILESRGVARASIAEMVEKGVSQEAETIQNALDDRALLIQWLSEHTDNSVSALSRSWPERFEDQLLRLLYAGFEPRKLRYAAHLFLRLLHSHLSEVCVDLKVECASSTYVLGIADPYGCLMPGQVHLVFSEEMTLPHGIRGCVMDNVDVLVARHPALRSSDIQKVSVVYERRLLHLRNVVVFPTRGCTPLAGKLQGGDYDGDRFWVCWEPNLVQSFTNAPAPLSEPDHTELGVHKDGRTLGEVLDNGGVANFISQGASLQLNDSCFGLVTRKREQICYMLLSMDAPLVNDLSDLHNVLIDSAKNGYSFGQSEWQKFLDGRLSSSEHQKLRNPAWRVAKEKKKKDLSVLANGHEFGYKPEHIIDHVIFDIAAPKCYAFWKEFQTSLEAQASDYDQDLSILYATFSPEDTTQPALRGIKHNLDMDMDTLLRQVRYPDTQADAWFGESVNNNEEWAKTYEQIRVAFDNIQPRCTSDRRIQSTDELLYILTLRANGAPSLWDLLKSSAMWRIQQSMSRSAQLCFKVSGKNLCSLKAHISGGSILDGQGEPVAPVYVIPEILSLMRVHRKASLVSEAEVDADGDLQMTTEDSTGTERNPVEHLSHIFGSNFSPFAQ